MKRRLLGSLVAAALALGLLPGVACAAVPGSLDQNVPPAGTPVMNGFAGGTAVTQTFTAGVTGAVTHIELYCSGFGGATAAIDLYFTTYHEGSATCPATAGWVDVPFNLSQLMAAGYSTYLMIVGSDAFSLGVAASDYAGGAAGDAGFSLIPGVTDFAFRTYVQPIQVMTNTWSPASVPSGVSTPVLLTAQVSFPEISLDPLLDPLYYRFQLPGLPSWFTPSGAISCSTPIAPADCSLAELQSPGGASWQGDGTAVTVTVNIPGTAAPGAEDGPESAETYSCVLGASSGDPPFFEFGMCESAMGQLGVGNVTPPPTATAPGSGSPGGAPLWLLPGVLAALASSLLATWRQAKRVRAR